MVEDQAPHGPIFFLFTRRQTTNVQNEIGWGAKIIVQLTSLIVAVSVASHLRLFKCFLLAFCLGECIAYETFLSCLEPRGKQQPEI